MDETLPTLEEVRNFYRNDLFAVEALGAHIDSVGDKTATASFTIEEKHRNAVGSVMGGALYSLADFACAAAVYLPDNPSVTLDGSMQFLSVAKGSVITATATADKRGRSVSFCRVNITDNTGLLVATANYTFFRKPAKKS